MAINGIFGTATNATGATNSFSTGRTNIQSNATNSPSDDATSVKISDTEKNRAAGVDSAIRYLKPLQTVVETASSATDRAGEVLNQTLSLAKQVAAEVDPTKKSVLASDGATLLAELDKIASTKTPEGVSVIGQGSLSYSVSLDKPGDSKGNSIAVNIPNIQISKADLGVSSVTSSALKDSNDASQQSLSDAINTVSNIAASLKSTLTSILQTADANGASRAAQGAVTENNADDLANKIASALKSAPGLADTNNLDTTKVLDLIKAPEENKPAQTTSSTTPSVKPKDKKEEDLFNPLLVSTGDAVDPGASF